MKIYITLLLSIFIFACQKNEPEIAGADELSSISYSEKIYTQPVEIDNQIVSVVNDGSSTFLTSYGQDGNKIWCNSIDAHIIPGNSFEDIEYFETKANSNDEIVLNMIDAEQNHKTVTYSSSGDYIYEFSDVIYQTDSIFIGTDTIDLNGMSRFIIKSISPLSNGDNAVISSWTPDYANRLTDTTIIQLSLYTGNGQFIEDQYIIIDESIDIQKVFVASNDDLIFVAEGFNGNPFIFITDIQGNFIGINTELNVFEIYSFFENSNGEYVFSAGTFNNNADYIGLLFSINRQGEGLWSKTYVNNSAWIFTSMAEMNDGYLFTGFNINKVLLGIDWRTTFDTENVKAVTLKTDFQGEELTRNILQTQESTVGASVLINENITFFAGKYDRSINNAIILKLNEELKIIN